MRILLIAEACNPEWVSVPLVGWSHSQAIRNLPSVDAHLVTHTRNRDAILRAGLEEGADFTAINSDAIMWPAWKLSSLLRGGEGKGWTTVSAIYSMAYPYFERLVWKRFGEDVKQGKFDLVHRLTPLSPTTPSPIAKKCARAKVPFVLGPLNGGLPWPREYDGHRRKEKEWLSYVRGAYRQLPGYGSTREAATAIIVGSKATRDQMPKRFRSKCTYITENGIDTNRFTLAPRSSAPKRPLRAAFVGRLVPYKGVDIVIDAAAQLVRDGLLTVDIYGDGPEHSALQEQILSTGTSEGIKLHGNLPHKQLNQALGKAHLLVFPSVREFGGAVVLEAMALGIVPIVVDYGGPAELIDSNSGFAIPISNREGLVKAFAKRLGELCDAPEQLVELSRAAVQRVKDEFTWEKKALQVRRVYDSVLATSDRLA